MSSSFRKLLLFIVSVLVFALACQTLTPENGSPPALQADPTTAAPATLAAATAAPVEPASPPAPTGTQLPTLFPDDCYWEFIDTNDALATGGGTPGMSASWAGTSITTSFAHAGNFGCSEQTFNTTHDWTEPGNKLYSGDEITFFVSLSWQLVGTPECTSLTAGAVTYVTAGDTTFKAEQSSINLSSKPEGLVFSDSGSWVVPTGSAGDLMDIRAHGSSGSLGGTITYHYRYVCKSTP